MEVMIVQLLLKGGAEDFDDMLDELGGLGKPKLYWTLKEAGNTNIMNLQNGKISRLLI